MKTHTNGELLLIAVSNYNLLKLTKFEDDGTEEIFPKNRKMIITDKEKYEQTNKICKILEPFLDQNDRLMKLIKPYMENVESQEEFDPKKLYGFETICIESIDYLLQHYQKGLKASKEYKKIKEKLAKQKGKTAKTKSTDRDIQQYKKIINQFNSMKRIFQKTKSAKDLEALNLAKKTLI